MKYDKNSIDEQAENEAIALNKVGSSSNSNYKRIRLEKDYNNDSIDKFNKLFKSN